MPRAGGETAGLKPVRIGCSGWHYKHWRNVLYPEGMGSGRWLGLYAEVFDTVETNSTFYRLPTRKAVEGWAAQSPEGFLFAVKIGRYVTHIKRLHDLETALGRFREPIEPLLEAGKLGPLLWQLPENFKRDDDRLGEALSATAAGRWGARPHAFEFRHQSWFCEPVYELLRRYRAGLVIGDHPERPFQTHELTGPLVYVRLHLGGARFGCYSEQQIEEWAALVSEWRIEREVFVYFNNDGHGCAVRNGVALGRSLGMDTTANLE